MYRYYFKWFVREVATQNIKMRHVRRASQLRLLRFSAHDHYSCQY